MSERASNVNWESFAHFSPDEWPAGTLGKMDARVIESLNRVRERLPANHAWTPSPVARGHVRDEESTSRHSAAGRLADATDGFVRWNHLWRWWIELQRDPEIGGIGVYPDMIWDGTFRARPMIHIDTRPERVLWVAVRDSRDDSMRYTTLLSEPLSFFEHLATRAHH